MRLEAADLLRGYLTYPDAETAKSAAREAGDAAAKVMAVWASSRAVCQSAGQLFIAT